MPDVIDEHRSEIEGICRRFGVARLDVFGSALGETFDLETSDIDFLVEMSSMTRVNAMLDTFAPVDSMGRQRLEIAQDFTDGIDELTGRLKTSKRRITAVRRR